MRLPRPAPVHQTTAAVPGGSDHLRSRANNDDTVSAEGATLSGWASPDRLLAITDTAQRRLRSDDLVTEIVEGLVAAGEYVTRVDLHPSQRMVDFNWAAHQAGRRLGIRVDVDLKVTRASVDGRAEVRVTPLPPPD